MVAAKRRKLDTALPHEQTVLLLEAKKQPYQLKTDHPLPEIKSDHELLVRNLAVGLNPIDWKAPDYGFGIPELPYLSGRENVGQVVLAARANPDIEPGQKVIVISTDYRDLRKAAYQQYAVATHFNVARLPSNISVEQGAATGVAFVTALLTLGVCAGVDFSPVLSGPDLHAAVRAVPEASIPADVRAETLHGMPAAARAAKGDWLAIWGASSTCALLVNQLARLAGLRTILVLDAAKHGRALGAADPAWRADAVVDAHDPQRAVRVVRAIAAGALRFGVDAAGRQSAELLEQCLAPPAEEAEPGRRSADLQTPTPPRSPPLSDGAGAAHLIGLTGLPATAAAGVVHHHVPVKLFHEVEAVGAAAVRWLERLLAEGVLVPPRVLGTVDGLEGVNGGLDRMRRREVSGGRLVAVLR